MDNNLQEEHSRHHSGSDAAIQISIKTFQFVEYIFISAFKRLSCRYETVRYSVLDK